MEKTTLSWHFLNGIILLNVIICVFYGILVLWLFESYYNQSYYLGETIENLKCDQENTLIRSGIEVREQAFKFISMELHDNISQVLSLAKLNLNRLLKQEDEVQESFLQDAKLYLSKSLTDLGSFSKSLDSDIILSHGLVKAIQYEIGIWNKHFNDQILLKQEGEIPEFEQHTLVIIFRIVQEALNNIIKHAKATEVNVCCITDDNSFTLMVKDNGVGFDVTHIYENKKSSFMSGLKNMRSRASLIGGSLTIESTSNIGTQLTLNIPLTQINQQ